MRKGVESNVVQFVGAFLILVISALIVWGFFVGKSYGTSEKETEVKTQGCDTDSDCDENIDGAKCLQIYPEYFTPFCGCLIDEDCLNKRSGVCGSNNKCT